MGEGSSKSAPTLILRQVLIGGRELMSMADIHSTLLAKDNKSIGSLDGVDEDRFGNEFDFNDQENEQQSNEGEDVYSDKEQSIAGVNGEMFNDQVQRKQEELPHNEGDKESDCVKNKNQENMHADQENGNSKENVNPRSNGEAENILKGMIQIFQDLLDLEGSDFMIGIIRIVGVPSNTRVMKAKEL
ncbi:unnamed protein product [Lactuca virosa]|uniref:Uncharacterized protein n=1 Tax=Lactuca virosa TaxID=75947 RepID=A0AAU9NRX4_9ASTR|nr:unnamed protein product [Lactuca virosa]